MATTNGIASRKVVPSNPIELSFPLPNAPTTKVYAHVTDSENSVLVFLTTQSEEAGSQLAGLGSFVLGMPNVG
jgi:hypothetical protein